MAISNNRSALPITIWKDGDREIAKHTLYYRTATRLKTADGPKSTEYRPSRLSYLDYRHVVSRSFIDDFPQGVTIFSRLYTRQHRDGNDLEILPSPLFRITNHPLDNLFLLSTQTTRPPQFAHVYYSPTQISPIRGKLDRVSGHQGVRLVRDSYHCVTSHETYLKEAANSTLKEGQNTSEDCDSLFPEDSSSDDVLEIAYNSPHSYTNFNPSSEWRTPVLVDIIVFLFRPIFGSNIDDIDIDLPHHTISLAPSLHSLFGNIYIFTERTEDLADIMLPSIEVEAQKDAPKPEEENNGKKTYARKKTANNPTARIGATIKDLEKSSTGTNNGSNQNADIDLDQPRMDQCRAMDNGSWETEDIHPPTATVEGQSEHNQDRGANDSQGS
ncbi:hypothetical protein F4782DRAFT_532377 [Xylaria castorea]|nr:hypothetical protein F4782DRAFT_532377 [Xylaria castorea]